MAERLIIYGSEKAAGLRVDVAANLLADRNPALTPLFDELYRRETRRATRGLIVWGSPLQNGGSWPEYVPLYHMSGIRRIDIANAGRRSPLLEDAVTTTSQLKSHGDVYLMTASFEPSAKAVARRLGIDNTQVHATRYPNVADVGPLSPDEIAIVERMKSKLMDPHLSNKHKYTELARYDQAFEDPENHALHGILNVVHPVVGGSEKMSRIDKIMFYRGIPYKKVIFIGTGLTGKTSLMTVSRNGGLGVAFNASPELLGYTRSLVAVNGDSTALLVPLIERWTEGGPRGVHAFVKEQTAKPTIARADTYHWMPGLSGPERKAIAGLHAAAKKRVSSL